MECLSKLNINKENKEIATTHPQTSQLAVSYKNVSRDYSTKSEYWFYVFYPQVKDRVYFMLKAYEDFLRFYYDSIIMEFDESQKIFFWKDEATFSNLYTTN